VFHFGGEHPSNIMYHTPRAHKKTDQDQEHQNTLSYVGFGMLFYFGNQKEMTELRRPQQAGLSLSNGNETSVTQHEKADHRSH
jgi:hypothetical protein